MAQTKALILFTLLLFLFPLPHTFSLTYESVKITSDIIEDTAYINYVLEALGPLDAINISVPPRSKVIYFSDPYSPLISYQMYPDKVIGQLKVPIKEGEKRIILLKVKSKYPLSYKWGVIEYINEFEFLEGVQDFEHLVLLPEGNKTQVLKFSPEGRTQTTGKQLSIKWNIKNYESEVFFIEFTGEGKNYFEIIVITILSLAGLAGLIYLFISIRKNLKQKKILENTKNLPEREKKLLDEILKEDGITQHKLRQTLSLSRSNASKILTSLEKKQIIRRERTGRVAKIYLVHKNSSVKKTGEGDEFKAR